MSSDVPVAIITAIGVVCAAAVPALILIRGQAQIKNAQAEIKESVGVPNGKGSVVEMNTQQLDELAALSAALDHHAALDAARFEILHKHLNLPFPEELPE